MKMSRLWLIGIFLLFSSMVLADDLKIHILTPTAPYADYLREVITDFNLINRRIKAANQATLPTIAVTIDPNIAINMHDAVITVTGREIAIKSSTGMGAGNALYRLLDLWGCRFVYPGELGEIIPAQTEYQLVDGEIVVKIAADPRVYAIHGNQDLKIFHQRNLHGTKRWMSAQHYWFYAMPPDKYFKDHPEYYSLIDGKRVPTQLCVSNPDVRKIMAEKALDYFKLLPYADSFPMDPEDALSFCQCPDCEKLDEPAVYLDGMKSVAGRVVDFANYVARHLQKELPGKKVGFHAYISHKLPPAGAIEENVFITYCRDSTCLLHLMPNDRCPTANQYWTLLKEWARKMHSRNLAVYEYDPVSWIGGLPCPIYLQRGEAIKMQYQITDLLGVVNDTGPQRDAANFVNRYMEIRMMVDPSRDPKTELKEMCLAFFGPQAGPLMNEYYLNLAKACDNDIDQRFGIDGYENIFTPGIVKESRRLLDKAKKQSNQNDKKLRRRFNVVELEQQYLESFMQFHWNLAKKDYQGSLADIAKVYQTINNLADCADAAFSDPNEARHRIKNSEMYNLARIFYKELGFIRNWQIAGPFANPKSSALLTAPKPTISDGRLAGAIDYTSPNGQIDFRLALGNKLKPNTTNYFYAMTSYDSPASIKAQLRIDSFNPFAVYLNDVRVYDRPGVDEDCPDKRIVPIMLKPGKNVLTVMVDQIIVAPYIKLGFWARITDVDGKPITQDGVKGDAGAI